MDYVEFLLEYTNYLLEHLKNRKLKKILAFYKPKLEELIKDKSPFTEPLIPHYIMQGMFLLSKQK